MRGVDFRLIATFGLGAVRPKSRKRVFAMFFVLPSFRFFCKHMLTLDSRGNVSFFLRPIDCADRSPKMIHRGRPELGTPAKIPESPQTHQH